MASTLPTPEPIVKDGRLDDVLYPLHQIILLAKPKAEPDFVAFCRGLERDQAEEDTLSLDAQVVQGMRECADKVLSGKLRVGTIADRLNDGRPEKEKLRERTVGDVMTRLGFRPCRLGAGHAARFWDEKRLEKLERRYKLAGSPEDSEEPEHGQKNFLRKMIGPTAEEEPTQQRMETPGDPQSGEGFADLAALLKSGEAEKLGPLQISPAEWVEDVPLFLKAHLRDLTYPTLAEPARLRLIALRETLALVEQ